MRQLKITKSITNRESASLDKYLQEIGKEELITVDHVIYQLSDGTWAGKDDTAPSQHFGNSNPSTTPAMWSNDAYSPSAGTIYFAVTR